MSILIFFILILLIIKMFKLETRLSLILAILITYLVYSDKSILSKVQNIKFKTKNIENINDIPDIILSDWYDYYKDNLKDINEHNKENYNNIMKSLKLFQQIYLEIINGGNIPHQRLDNLKLLQKEILNIIHSTIYNLPVTKDETLENILSKKMDNIKEDLEFRAEEIRNFINKEWDNGNINYLSKPIYSNTLTGLAPDYSPNYNFY